MPYAFTFTQHAVARFVERVAPRMIIDNAQAWLEAHACAASPLPDRTPRGQRQWLLPGPADRDAVLVTKDDPGGVYVVVTIGWWEHETEADPDDLPRPAVAPPASSAPTAAPAAWVRPPWLPSRPAGLAAPPGTLRVGLDAKGQTLDLAALTYEDLTGWLGYLNACFRAYAARNLAPPAHLVAARGRIKALALVALAVRIKAKEQAKKAAADGLLPKRTRYQLVHAVGEVLRERLGEEETAAIFTEAKRRVAQATTDENGRQ